MAVTNNKARVFYVVVPKVACTSIKTMFWELETGQDSTKRSLPQRLRAKIGGKTPQFPIHHLDGYVTRKFTRIGVVPDGYAKICVVRDPLTRLKSAWTNKVGAKIFKHRGDTQDIINSDLLLEPSFSFYVEHLERYRLVSRASRIHTEGYAWHIGEDLSWYDRVFRLEDLRAFEEYISDRAGRAVTIPMRNEGGGAPRPLDFERHHIDAARRALKADYALLSDYYDFDRSMANFLANNDISL